MRPSGTALRFAVLGDSIAVGQGAVRPADALAPRLVTALADEGIESETRVFAISGARSSDLPRQADAALAWAAQVALVVIGANDLTHLVPVERAVADLEVALRRLRDARIEVVLAPAPDLSSVPHVPPALRPLVRLASEELRRSQTRTALAAGVRITDRDGATAAAFASDAGLFSRDRFHPSSAGYELIARAVLPDVRAAARAVGGRPG